MFTKSDLKTGMLVETQCEGLYFVMLNTGTERTNNVLKTKRGWMDLDQYQEDLTLKSDHDFDIMKVYSVKLECNLFKCFDDNDIIIPTSAELIYERFNEEMESAIKTANIMLDVAREFADKNKLGDGYHEKHFPIGEGMEVVIYSYGGGSLRASVSDNCGFYKYLS